MFSFLDIETHRVFGGPKFGVPTLAVQDQHNDFNAFFHVGSWLVQSDSGSDQSYSSSVSERYERMDFLCTCLNVYVAPEIEIQMTVSTNLTRDNVQTIIDNLAGMYGIDPSRINVTVVVDATTQPPTYTLIIVINSPTSKIHHSSVRDL